MTRESTRSWFGLLVILCPVLLVSMDQQLWLLDVYGFAVGSLLIAFGAIGDRYGRVKLLMIGATVFGAASAGAAFAPSPELLIAFRAVMGLAGATLLPSALAVLSELFTDPRRRAQAIGVFAAAFAAGFAIGPVVGGALLERFWWGSVFLINLPVIAVFLLLAPVLLREVRATGTGRVDVPSVLLSAVGLLLAIYGVKHTAAAGLSLAGAAAWSVAAYLAGIHLQSVLGLAVLDAALLALPGAAVLTTMCVVTPALVDRVGKKTALVVRHFSIATGLLLVLSLLHVALGALALRWLPQSAKALVPQASE
jgi:DHA2 family multidrug resistance protein-like MFS transporter